MLSLNALCFYMENGIDELVPQPNKEDDNRPWHPPNIQCTKHLSMRLVVEVEPAIRDAHERYKADPQRYTYSKVFLDQSSFDVLQDYVNQYCDHLGIPENLYWKVNEVGKVRSTLLKQTMACCKKQQLWRAPLRDGIAKFAKALQDADIEECNPQVDSEMYGQSSDEGDSIRDGSRQMVTRSRRANRRVGRIEPSSDSYSLDSNASARTTCSVQPAARVKAGSINFQYMSHARKQELIALPKEPGQLILIKHEEFFDCYHTGMTVEDVGPAPTHLDNFPLFPATSQHMKAMWEVFRDYGFRLPTDFMWPYIPRRPVAVKEHILPLPRDLPQFPSHDRIFRDYNVDEKDVNIVSLDRLFDPDAPDRTREAVYFANCACCSHFF